MGWSIGFDTNWNRDIGYGVPAICDLPDCNKKIDRGLSYVCGSEPYGGDYGCGLYFCEKHLKTRKPHGSDKDVGLCPRCYKYKSPYKAKPDCREWIMWKLKDKSWAEWRKDNPEEVNKMEKAIDTKTVPTSTGGGNDFSPSIGVTTYIPKKNKIDTKYE